MVDGVLTSWPEGSLSMITEILMNAGTYKATSTINPKNKICLMYGLNGTGKSTISNFLYSPLDPFYSGCKYKSEKDVDLLVYNQRFLADYFFEEDSLKGIFTLSKENKQVILQVDQESDKLAGLQELRASAVEKLRLLRERIDKEKAGAAAKVWEIKTEYAGGDRILEFCLEGLKRTELLFNHICSVSLPDTPVSYTVDDLKAEAISIQGEAAVELQKLKSIDFSWLFIECEPVFSKVIVGSQEGSVAQFINKLGNTDWVKIGLNFLHEHESPDVQDCPFCQKPTVSRELVEAIKDVFDEQYDLDVAKLLSLKDEYHSSFSNIIFHDISNLPLNDKELQHLFVTTVESLKATHRENMLIIDKKLSNPSLPVQLKSSASLAGLIADVVVKVNEYIESHNHKLANKKQTLASIKDKFWVFMRVRYDQTLSAYKESFLSLSEIGRKGAQDVRNFDASIESSTVVISDLRKQTVNIEEAIQSINASLLEIGIDGFSVVKHSESLYRIARAGVDADAFHSLSEGEKTVISFLYFIELCRGQKTASAVPREKIVVIDDPISSLSHLYIFNIGQLIKRYFFDDKKYSQVLVLTHSLYFFYELTFVNKEQRDEKQSLYRIVKNSMGSSIVPMHYEEIQNDYQSYWAMIKDPSCPPAIIANCMRNVIEYFFGFVRKSSFGNVFQMKELSSDKFKAFYRYMNRESHSFGQNIFDIKEFDYEVFKEGLRLVFKECGYEEHYKAMLK